MYKIEYDININDNGRPYIDIPEDYEHKSEDKFFAFEITRYILQAVYNNRSEEFDIETSEKINTAINLIGQISDEIAEILWNQMKNMGDISLITDSKYHIQVNTIKDRNDLMSLNSNYIFYNGKIFKKDNGLKVLVVEDNMTIYELVNNEWI